MNERETLRRRQAFRAVLDRTFHHFPRAAVEAWALAQFELISKGSRNRFDVSDEALGAWIRTAAPSWQEQEVRQIWGRGWAQGVEVDER